MSAGAPSASALFCIANHLIRTLLGMKPMQLLLILPFRQTAGSTLDANSPQHCKLRWQTCAYARLSTADAGVVHGMW